MTQRQNYDNWPYVIDVRFPWIRGFATNRPQGVGHYGVLVDTRTGEQAQVSNPRELAAFIAAHSSSTGHGGLGDVVKSITKFFGFGDCTPCEKRRAALNAVAPRVFRR